MRVRPVGVHDPSLSRLARLRASKTGKRGSNAGRDFHRFAQRGGKALPVKVSTIRIPIRKKVKIGFGKKRTKDCDVDFPILLPSSWIKTLLNMHPSFVLGGHQVTDTEEFTSIFREFWGNFELAQPEHPIFSLFTDAQRKYTVPMALHGDEGRGLSKIPVLVLSYQFIIPFSGPNDLSSRMTLGRAEKLFVMF